jgi:hypothetical protein
MQSQILRGDVKKHSSDPAQSGRPGGDTTEGRDGWYVWEEGKGKAEERVMQGVLLSQIEEEEGGKGRRKRGEREGQCSAMLRCFRFRQPGTAMQYAIRFRQPGTAM